MKSIDVQQVRDDTAEILRRVEAGERFVVTRDGSPIADLVPHRAAPVRRRITVGEAQALMRSLPPIDVDQWYRDREADDALFGSDDILD